MLAFQVYFMSTKIAQFWANDTCRDETFTSSGIYSVVIKNHQNTRLIILNARHKIRRHKTHHVHRTMIYKNLKHQYSRMILDLRIVVYWNIFKNVWIRERWNVYPVDASSLTFEVFVNVFSHCLYIQDEFMRLKHR